MWIFGSYILGMNNPSHDTDWFWSFIPFFIETLFFVILGFTQAAISLKIRNQALVRKSRKWNGNQALFSKIDQHRQVVKERSHNQNWKWYKTSWYTSSKKKSEAVLIPRKSKKSKPQKFDYKFWFCIKNNACIPNLSAWMRV